MHCWCRHGKVLKEALVKQREEQLQLECTFKPKVDERSAALAAKAPRTHPADADSVLERVAQQARDRDEKLERLRREREAEELRECTFAPKVQPRAAGAKKEGGRAVVSSDATRGGEGGEGASGVVVRGLGRYMELKQMAKAQAEAQKQREQRAFLTEPSARTLAYTVPQPFRIHEPSEAATERSQRMLSELEQERMAECTFHPKTNEASSKQLMKQVLKKGR